MQSLIARTFFGFVQLFIFICVLLFLPSCSFDYWQGWLYLISFFIPVLLITLYFLRKDPGLIGRRLKAGPAAEERRSQKLIQTFSSIFFILLMLVPGIDHRLGLSNIPVFIVISADCFVAISFLMIFYVFKENSFTSGIIEITDNQKVISSGPYAIVRHPMYSAALILLFFTPVALGSWYGMAFFIPFVVVMILRIKDEEALLSKDLSGYKEYSETVRYRLVPYVW